LVLCLTVCLEFETLLCTRNDSEDIKNLMVSAAMLTFLNFYKREVLLLIHAVIPVFRYSALSCHLLKVSTSLLQMGLPSGNKHELILKQGFTNLPKM
jgi:hypothetical protein